MAKQKKEEELDIVTKSAGPERETVVTRWFKDYAVNNPKELKQICELVGRFMKDQFAMNLAESSHIELWGAAFYGIFTSVLNYLKSQQKKYRQFSMVIANSINIGYSNNEDEDNEKVGNFMPILEHVGLNRTLVDRDSGLLSEKCIKWTQMNVKSNMEAIKTIQMDAFKNLIDNYRINLKTPEVMIPLLCVFLDTIVMVLKRKYEEADKTDVSEVSMDIFGLFKAYYSYDEDDDQEIIDFTPNVMMKLSLKSDAMSGKE